MRIRVKSKWNDKKRERTPTEVGSALAFNLWRIAGANVLNLENEGFQTDTQSQRLDVIAELVAFFVHVVDRMLATREYTDDDRGELITALALNLAKTMHDNRMDFVEENERGTDYKGQFIDLLNARMAEFAEFSFQDNEPGFQLKRRVGDHVTAVMGDKDKKWITDQVLDIEIPDAMKTFKRVARDLLGKG